MGGGSPRGLLRNEAATEMRRHLEFRGAFFFSPLRCALRLRFVDAPGEAVSLSCAVSSPYFRIFP